MSERMFPIMGLDYQYREQVASARAAGCTMIVVQIPWRLLAPHARQVDRNHGQTLERLAERGGLGAAEAVAVLEDRAWKGMKFGEAHARLFAIVSADAGRVPE